MPDDLRVRFDPLDALRDQQDQLRAALAKLDRLDDGAGDGRASAREPRDDDRPPRRGAQSPARIWRQSALLAGAKYRPCGAPSPSE